MANAHRGVRYRLLVSLDPFQFGVVRDCQTDHLVRIDPRAELTVERRHRELVDDFGVVVGSVAYDPICGGTRLTPARRMRRPRSVPKQPPLTCLITTSSPGSGSNPGLGSPVGRESFSGECSSGSRGACRTRAVRPYARH